MRGMLVMMTKCQFPAFLLLFPSSNHRLHPHLPPLRYQLRHCRLLLCWQPAAFMPSQSPVAADSLRSNTSDSAPPPTHPRRPRSSSHRSISTITSFENSFGEEEPWEEYRRLVNESRVFCMLMWKGLWICQGWDSIRNKPVSIALGLSPT